MRWRRSAVFLHVARRFSHFSFSDSFVSIITKATFGTNAFVTVNPLTV